MSELALYLFGTPRVELNGAQVHLGRRKAVALLVYLALERQSQSREKLAFIFEAGESDFLARKNLNNAFSLLYQTLGEQWFEKDREGIGLSASTQPWIDVIEFQSLLASCHSHGHPADEVCPRCILALEKAVTLYANDFLDGFTLPAHEGFEAWQAQKASNLRDALENSLKKLGRAYIAQGDFRSALVHVEQRIKLDPLNESAHRQLMLLYAWL